MTDALIANLHSSKKSDWQTPPDVIERARRVMGGIDLDPASSKAANKTIKARHFFTEQSNAFAFDWHGRVWLNCPFGFAWAKTGLPTGTSTRAKGSVSSIELWVAKLIFEFLGGNLTQACLLVTNGTDAGWCQWLRRFPICLPEGRLQFLDANGVPARQNTKGSLIAGLGVDEDRFYDAFGPLGRICDAEHRGVRRRQARHLKEMRKVLSGLEVG